PIILAPGLRAAYFYLPIACPYFKAWLGMHGWAVKHTAIRQRKTRCVIWTNNTVSNQFALGKRPAEMGAGLRQRKETFPTTNQQNGRALVHRPGGCIVRQI